MTIEQYATLRDQVEYGYRAQVDMAQENDLGPATTALVIATRINTARAMREADTR